MTTAADQYHHTGGLLQGATSNSYLGGEPGAFDPYADEQPPQVGLGTHSIRLCTLTIHDMLTSSADVCVQGEEGSWDASSKGLQPPPPPPTSSDGVQRVWVLVGGEGQAGEISLASGRHILQQLQHEPGVQVWWQAWGLKTATCPQTELFMLAPHTWNRGEVARRQELLVRRRNLLQLNLPEEEIPEELSLSQIRCVCDH